MGAQPFPVLTPPLPPEIIKMLYLVNQLSKRLHSMTKRCRKDGFLSTFNAFCYCI